MCMRAHIRTYVLVPTYVRTYVRTYAHMYIHMYTYSHTCYAHTRWDNKTLRFCCSVFSGTVFHVLMVVPLIHNCKLYYTKRLGSLVVPRSMHVPHICVCVNQMGEPNIRKAVISKPNVKRLIKTNKHAEVHRNELKARGVHTYGSR